MVHIVKNIGASCVWILLVGWCLVYGIQLNKTRPTTWKVLFECRRTWVLCCYNKQFLTNPLSVTKVELGMWNYNKEKIGKPNTNKLWLKERKKSSIKEQSLVRVFLYTKSTKRATEKVK